jgi:adenylate cyclase
MRVRDLLIGRSALRFRAVADEGTRTVRARLGAAARKVDHHPALLTVAKLVREALPGDSRFGDPLSTAGTGQAELAGRRLAELTAERPGVLRETGLSALQIWQSISEAQGRGRSDTEVTIVFTDLVRFSDWALQAGDDAALELLREVGQVSEPPVTDCGGRVVKRLGDGMMAVFPDPQPALEATLEICERVTAVEVDGYEPALRAGLHVGRPRRLGGDYLGVDVNVAARCAEQASPGELLVTDRALEHVDTAGLKVKRRRRFKVRGVPQDLTAHVVSRG